jgi:hypothetical protein
MRTDSIATESRLRTTRRGHAAGRTSLQPQAVDAAFDDESTPLIEIDNAQRSYRQDVGAAGFGGLPPHSLSGGVELLETLAEQLEQIEQQHWQIRRLLDRAGSLRIDAARS